MSGYFVDTSALAKLYHVEIGTEAMEVLVQTPQNRLIISQLSLIEIQSVFATKVRTGVIDRTTLGYLRGKFFSDLAKRRFDVAPLVRSHFLGAEELIRSSAVEFGLRTLDALQLAVSLDLRRRGVASHFVSSDKNLCQAAALEGLAVLNPSESL